MYDKKQLNYILMDPTLVGVIAHSGYLATHEGSLSDHVYAYVDFHKKMLFKGILNRLVEMHSREFQLKQTDKKVNLHRDAVRQAQHQ